MYFLPSGKVLIMFFHLFQFHGPLLTLVDLVDVCVDISKGCVYLEQMHFIHRYYDILDTRLLDGHMTIVTFG